MIKYPKWRKILNFSGRSFILSRLSNREKVNKIFTTLDFKALILLFSHLTRLKRLSIKTTSLFLTSLNLFLNYDERGFFLKISYFLQLRQKWVSITFSFPSDWPMKPSTNFRAGRPRSVNFDLEISRKFQVQIFLS